MEKKLLVLHHGFQTVSRDFPGSHGNQPAGATESSHKTPSSIPLEHWWKAMVSGLSLHVSG